MEKNLFIAMPVEEFQELIINSVNACLKHNPVVYFSPKSDERLTRREIRERYKISYPTIHKLMKEGMPFEKIGRKTVFRAEDIDKYITERKGGSHV